MSEKLGFKFYSVLKNEDADPFTIDGLMVVADGLGGAGSVVHELDKWRYKESYAKNFKHDMLRTAIPEYNEQSHQYLKPYIDDWFKPMIDAEPDTSALWASRIAIARFVFAITEEPKFLQGLADEDIRKEICKFVIKGLDKTVDVFKLKPGKYDNQKLLPTTLTALSYMDDGDDLLVEAAWAGDSRCYVLMPDGLKQLTVDDEDEAEAITNLFYTADKHNQRPYKPAILRYRKYRFNKPCILIAVSDGVFDPYAPHDNLGVEAVLLEKLLECKSSEELSEALKVHYDKVHGDDATMIFEPFGFDSYQHMKDVFTPRAQKVMDVWSKYHKMRSTLAIIDSPEAADDIVGKITSRTADKLETIAQLLAEAYSSKKKDFVLDTIGTAVIESTQERLRQEFESNKKERQREALQKIEEYILQNYAVVTKSILRKKVDFSQAKVLGKSFEAISQSASDLDYAQKAYDANCTRQEAAINLGDQTVAQISNLLSEIHTNLCNLFIPYQHRERWSDDYRALQRILGLYKLNRAECAIVIRNYPYIGKSVKKIAESMDDTMRKQNQNAKDIAASKKSLDAKKMQYEKSICAFFALRESVIHNAHLLFQPAFVAEYGLDFNKESFSVGADASTVIMRDLLKEFRSNPKVVEIIVKALADNYTAKSVIDSCYNESRLNNFREYYRLKATSSVDAESFKAELEAFVAEYEKLIN